MNNNRGSAFLMVLSLILVLMTVVVTVVATQANDNKIIDLYRHQMSNVYSALTLNRQVPDGTVGVSYSAQFKASGGVTPYTYEILDAANIPPGLSWNAGAGILSGTPSQAGIYTFRIKVTDSSEPAKSCIREYRVIIEDAGFVEYLLENNLYVFGNVVKIDGSSTIGGPDATVLIREGFQPGGGDVSYISTKNIFIEGNVTLTGSAGMGLLYDPNNPNDPYNPANPNHISYSSIYVDGNVTVEGGSQTEGYEGRIFGKLYYTGDLSVPHWFDLAAQTFKVTSIDNFPAFDIPELRAESWYEERGYTNNTTVRDNMRYYGPTIELKDVGNNQFYNSILVSTGDIVLGTNKNNKPTGNIHGSGILFAPNGTVIVPGSSSFTGIIIAREVWVSGSGEVVFRAVSSAADLPF